MYQPLTKEQFEKARSAGFSGPQIIEMEKRRKTEMSAAAPTPPARPTYGATFPASPNDSPLTAGLKSAGNLPKSAFNLGKTVVNAASHPVDTLKGLGSAFGGGVKKAAVALGAPDRPVFSEEEDAANAEAFGNLSSMLKERFGSLEAMQNTATNDPFGFGSDILGVLGGGAAAAGKGALASKAIAKTAQTATAPVRKAASMSKTGAGGALKFSTSQATGLNHETLATIVSDPASFTKEAMATLSRRTIADEIAQGLDTRSTKLADTGAHYNPIRSNKTPITVTNPNFLEYAIRGKTDLDVVDGRLTAKSTSNLRSPSDIRGLQQLYDFWNPVFQRGSMTPDEFLNFRQDLDQLANFERQVGKSAPLERTAQALRTDLNTTFRSQVKGLEDLDTQYASDISDFNRLKKNIIDHEGNLTESAVNRIANATGKGKDILIDKLEEITPGITQRIKTLKAVEDIQSLTSNIAGRYGRAGLFLGAAAYTLNPYLLVGTMMALPELAVPLLRGIGMTVPKIQETMTRLGRPLKAINELPEKGIAPINATMREQNIQPGLSTKAVKINPDDSAALTKFIDAIRLKGKSGAPDMKEADWTAAERILQKLGTVPDDLNKQALMAEKILTGEIDAQPLYRTGRDFKPTK
jgi:hypothetical protein